MGAEAGVVQAAPEASGPLAAFVVITRVHFCLTPGPFVSWLTRTHVPTGLNSTGAMDTGAGSTGVRGVLALWSGPFWRAFAEELVK